MSKHTLYLDIETLPAPEGVKEGMTIHPPGNIKKPESILKWVDENADAARDGQWRATALDPWSGSIACICYAVDDGPAIAAQGSESDMISELFSHYRAGITTICGHNVAAFDLAFIKARAVILGVPAPFGWPVSEPAWSPKIRDTMVLAAGIRDRISQDRLCKALSIPSSKGDFDGSQVADAWLHGGEEGRAKVIEYCKADVECVRQIDQRFKAVGM